MKEKKKGNQLGISIGGLLLLPHQVGKTRSSVMAVTTWVVWEGDF